MKGTARAVAVGCVLSLCLTLSTTPAAAQLSHIVGEGPESRAVRPNRYLLTAGAATVAAAYVPSFVVATTSNHGGDDWLYAPIIGPWGDIATRQGCASAGGNCDNEPLYKVLLWASGITQAVGAVGIISSFLIPEYRLQTTAQSTKPQLTVSPMHISKDGYGVGVAGRF